MTAKSKHSHQLHIYLTEAQAKKLKIIVFYSNRTRGDVVRELIDKMDYPGLGEVK